MALWKLLYAADVVWRRSPVLTEQQPACLRSALARLPSTLQGMLGCGRFPDASLGTSAMSCPLEDHPSGVYPLAEGAFPTGAAVEALPVGLSIPEAANHPGFDFLDVRLTAEGHRFYTVVEAKFTSGVTSIHGKDVADKLVLALTTYPELLAALREEHFCFVLATFQVLAEWLTPSSIGKLAHEKLSNNGRVMPVPSEEQLASTLVLLRRPHLEMLLTATLRSRAQFLRAVDQPELLQMQRTQSRLYAEQQSQPQPQPSLQAEKRTSPRNR